MWPKKYLAEQVIRYGKYDRSNDTNDYANLYYEPLNDPLIMDFAGNSTISDMNRWQPLALEFFKDQSGKVENLIKFLYQIKDHLVQHPQDRWFFVQMFMDSQNNMDAITRIAAPWEHNKHITPDFSFFQLKVTIMFVLEMKQEQIYLVEIII